ncbi:unnamed protein product, partial [Rangifer tarandus platyrhynchus]
IARMSPIKLLHTWALTLRRAGAEAAAPAGKWERRRRELKNSELTGTPRQEAQRAPRPPCA